LSSVSIRWPLPRQRHSRLPSLAGGRDGIEADRRILPRMDGMHSFATEPFGPISHRGTQGSYQPGTCNIGPHEIALRRRSGHVGAIVTLGLLAFLLAIGAPPAWRLLIAIPAAGTAVTYLQAILHFCVAFGMAGVFNFGRVGRQTTVADAAARRADRARALRMVAAGCAIGLGVGVLAVLI
jgi:hypothetical protein